MAFIRTVKQENPFSQIDRFVFESDDTITWKAKGLMGYFLTRPDNWKINHKDLVNRAKDGKDAVTSALQELQKAGYIHYYQERLSNGKFGDWLYDVYERPSFNPLYNKVLPNTEKPYAENSDTEKPNTENTDYNNNKDINNKPNNNKSNNNKLIIEEEKDFQINNFAFKTLVNEFQEEYPNVFDNDLWQSIYNAMIELKIDFITLKEAENQARIMDKKISDGKEIHDYAKYFVGGIKKMRKSKHSALVANKMSKYKPKEKKVENENTVPFYNWLEQ
jgi:hypothetical protein